MAGTYIVEIMTSKIPTFWSQYGVLLTPESAQPSSNRGANRAGKAKIRLMTNPNPTAIRNKVSALYMGAPPERARKAPARASGGGHVLSPTEKVHPASAAAAPVRTSRK